MTEHILSSTDLIHVRGQLIKAEPSVDLQSTILVTLELITNADVLPVIDAVQKAVSPFPTKEMNIYLHDFKAAYEIGGNGHVLLTLHVQIVEDDYEKTLGKLVNMSKQHTAIMIELMLWKLITAAKPQSRVHTSTHMKFIWDLHKIEKLKAKSMSESGFSHDTSTDSYYGPGSHPHSHPLLTHIQQEEEEVCEDGLYEVSEDIVSKLNNTKTEIDDNVEILKKAISIPYNLEELQEKQSVIHELVSKTKESIAKYEKKRSLRQFNSSLTSIKNDMDIFFSNYNK